MSYHHHRQKEWGRNPKMERTVTAIMFAVVVGALLVFLGLLGMVLPQRKCNQDQQESGKMAFGRWHGDPPVIFEG